MNNNNCKHEYKTSLIIIIVIIDLSRNLIYCIIVCTLNNGCVVCVVWKLSASKQFS